MLKKEEIIKGLENEDSDVREAVYRYVCNLHLYDDKEINEALIDFIKKDYDVINYASLKYSKLNKEIIETLIKISLSEKDDKIKERINAVLVRHYFIIKDLDYNFDEIIKSNDTDTLLYKKLKHFSKKTPSQLIELYKNNINEYYLKDENTLTTEIIGLALGELLVQTEEGKKELFSYIFNETNFWDDDNDMVNMEFIEEYMPYLVYPLASSNEVDFEEIMLLFYFYDMDFIAYYEECNHYFSNICTEDFVDFYIDLLKACKNNIEDYFYDIATYLNSEKIDEFLMKTLKKSKDKEIIENLIQILAARFNFDVIPYALKYKEDDEILDEEMFDYSVEPLLKLKEELVNIEKNN